MATRGPWWGWFAAVTSGASIVGGMWTALGRRPRNAWIAAHARWMSWSYVGLVAALVVESATRFIMPALGPRAPGSATWPALWALVIAASAGVVGVGAWLIRRRLPETVADLRARTAGSNLTG